MRLGTVISNKEGLFVVTKLENGYIAETQRIEDYIARIVVVEIDGEKRTIKQIIDEYCDKYLSEYEVIEEKTL